MTLLLPFMTCGMMGDLTPARPLAADTEILVTTKTRAPVGRVPARVKWSQVLDGPDRLDSVTMPKWFLKQNGVRVSRPELAKYGWCIKHSGHWYTLDRVTSDNEITVTFAGRSIEVSELKRSFSSVGRTSFTRTAEFPTVIMDDLLLGAGPIEMSDPDFEITSSPYPFRNYLWSGSGIKAATIDVESDATFQTTGDFVANSSSQGPTAYVWQDWNKAMGYGTTFALHVDYVPRAGDTELLTYHKWIGVTPREFYPVSRGASFRLSFDAWIAFWTTYTNPPSWSPTAYPDLWDEVVANGATMQVQFWWYAADQTTLLGRDCYDIAHPTYSRQRQYFPSEGTYVAAKGDYVRPVIAVYWPKNMAIPAGAPVGVNSYFCVDDFLLDGQDLSEPCGWEYYGAEMNVRDTDILHTDEAWIEFGTWTVGATDRSSTTVGNQLVYIITGDVCTIHFAAGGVGALCDIFVDDTAVESAHDVSAAGTYEITGLDDSVEHIVKVRVAAVKVAVEKLVVSPDQRVTVSWPDMRADECLADLISAVGGEVFVDTENKRLYHLDAVGQDLLAENIIDLRRGANLLSCDITAQRTEIVNHLLYLGYGSGATRLRLTVVGQGVNSDGDTSVEAYDVQWGKYENSDCQDSYLGQLEAQALVDEWQWPATEYRLTCPDDTAAYIAAGDTVRIYWDADPDDIINVSVRVLEVTRDNEGGSASLTVGARVSQLPDRLAATASKIDRVSRNL